MILHFPLAVWQQLREYITASLPNDINSWKGNYVFNLVSNANGDSLIRLDFLKPFRATIPDIKLQIDYPELSPELQEQYIAEVKAKVKPMTEQNSPLLGTMHPGHTYPRSEKELSRLMQGGDFT